MCPDGFQGRTGAIDIGAKPTNVWRVLLVLLLLVVQLAVAREGIFSDLIVNRFKTRYGQPATERLLSWEQLMLTYADSDRHSKLKRINDFFNRIKWLADQEVWGSRDYWATPLEMIGKNAGDCEDYSIAKYVSLLRMGIEQKKLRITYVRAPRLRQTHMVLAYYSTPDAEPLILDNLNKRILPASQRGDLIPVYSFNTSGLWTAGAPGTVRRVGGSSRLAAWRDVSMRMRREGFPGNG